MSSIPRTFYVYVLARPDGRAFYVGKGLNERIFDHEMEARGGCQCHKCRVIRKIWRNGGQVQRYTVFTTENEREALSYEIELIAQYGRKNLCNKTNGGDGCSGREMSEETRRKISAAHTGRTLSPERREKCRIAAKMVQWRPESRAKISAALTGRPVSEETRAKIGASNRGKKRTPEQIRAVSEAHKGYRVSDEARKKISLFHKGRKHGPMSAKQRDDIALFKSSGKRYTIVSPDGTHYTGVINAAKFAKEHGLRGNLLRMVLRGERPHTMGWTGWIEEESGKWI